MRFWFLFVIFLVVNGNAVAEMRGIWVDAFGPGFKTKEEVKQLVADCRKYNFNAVFVQMRKRGDAYYRPKSPNSDPRAMEIDSDYDALAEIIKECHTGEPRIEVHCWVVAYFVWAFDKPPPQKTHVFHVRNDLLTKDSIGQTVVGNGYYLDPGHPEVSRLLTDMAKDIVGRYDIDGFHWDYLRYPDRDAGYNPVALQRFKKETGSTNDPAPDDVRFCEWRRSQVTHFVKESSVELKKLKPKLMISASVFSNYKDSYDHRMADWVKWNNEGLLDGVVPMDFSPNNASIFNPRADFAFTNQGKGTIWIGQGAYMNTPENTVRQLQYCRSKGFSGTIFYSYRNFSPASSHAASQAHSERKFEGRKQVIVDNVDAKVIGPWKPSEFGKPHGDDYLFIPKGSGSNSVMFQANLPVVGDYDVYEWHVAGKNRSTAVPHSIKGVDGTKEIFVNQQTNGSQWNPLGRFSFNGNAEVSVTDAVKGEKSVAIADAIRFVLTPSKGDPASGLESNDRDYLRKKQIETFSYLKEHHQSNWVFSPIISEK